MREQFHATAVAHGGRGCLIVGRAGAGKSTLALELIALGAALVADDRVDATSTGDAVLLSAPEALEGLIEARGTGLLRLPFERHVPVHLMVDLDTSADGRLPVPENRDLLGHAVPVINGPVRPGLAATLMLLMGGAERLDPERPVGG